MFYNVATFLVCRLVPGAEPRATPTLPDIADHYYTREVELAKVVSFNPASVLDIAIIRLCKMLAKLV